MSEIIFDYNRARDYIEEHELEYMKPRIEQAHDMIHKKSGPGGSQLGWLTLGEDITEEDLQQIEQTAARIREMAEVFIVIGIGGSYLGARAALEALTGTFANYRFSENEKGAPVILFAGNNISSKYLADLIDLVQDREVAVNVISKSGGTLEPALGFRLLRSHMESRYGKEGARERIVVTTDGEKGILKEIADQEGYETFVIPPDIGGRYSVITPVGLFPMAVGGIDIRAILKGYRKGSLGFNNPGLEDNPAYQYAAVRNLLYNKGKIIELWVNYEPAFYYLSEWWKQLFGESEGKDSKGIFPACLNFTTDLHSMGQYIQEGRRELFLTTLWSPKPASEVEIPQLDKDDDKLNYLAGKSLHHVNESAFQGTLQAHTSGGVPNLVVEMPEISAYYFGYLIYFLQKACALSGYLLGVNPFNQPGVEAYKQNMFDLLGKNK